VSFGAGWLAQHRAAAEDDAGGFHGVLRSQSRVRTAVAAKSRATPELPPELLRGRRGDSVRACEERRRIWDKRGVGYGWGADSGVSLYPPTLLSHPA
jgi:hypothetical protein